MLLVFNKPYGILSQFTVECEGQHTLAEFGFPQGVYPIGRLDADSEGLLLLSDEAGLNTRLLDPKQSHWRSYLAQVEGTPDQASLSRLATGVLVQGRKTLPAKARLLSPQPDVSPRTPPIRVRQHIPTAWIEIELREGRNRQVRRMTAAVGLPTLRLFRQRIGSFFMPTDLTPGQWREMTEAERSLLFR